MLLCFVKVNEWEKLGNVSRFLAEELEIVSLGLVEMENWAQVKKVWNNGLKAVKSFEKPTFSVGFEDSKNKRHIWNNWF